MFQATYKQNGITVTFSSTLRNVIRLRRFSDLMPVDQDAADGDIRVMFRMIAATAISVKGINWQPPMDTASAADLDQSYETILDAIDIQVLRALDETASALFTSNADKVEGPKEALTDVERADPN